MERFVWINGNAEAGNDMTDCVTKKKSYSMEMSPISSNRQRVCIRTVVFLSEHSLYGQLLIDLAFIIGENNLLLRHIAKEPRTDKNQYKHIYYIKTLRVFDCASKEQSYKMGM